MKKVNWTVTVVISIVVLFVLMIGASLLNGCGNGGWGYDGWGMMGQWMMGGMFFMWVIPIGFIVLTVFGVAWLVRAFSGGNNPLVPSRPCPSCGRDVQTDWRNCPFCGAPLKK